MSPELVLVDPSLAGLEPPRRTEATPARVRQLRVVGAPSSGQLRGRVKELGHSGRFGATVAVASTVLAIFSLSEVRIDFGGGNDNAPAVHPTPPVVTTPATPPMTLPLAKPDERAHGPSQEPAKAKPAAQPQRFAWAPTPGASGYRVELYLRGARVFARQTTQPAMTLPQSWSYQGRTRTLEPGTYTWYVWSVRDGQRATQATVQSQLVVPSS